jgi:glycosyltransferase involved in cell wall biosynthesis
MNNGYLSPGMSGGSRNMIDIAVVWAATQDVLFVLPDVAEGVLPASMKRVTYRSHFPRGVVDTAGTYVVRMWKASHIAHARPAQFVVCASSLLHDVLPAWIHSRRHKSVMVVIVYHLVPRRSSANPARQVQFLLARLAQAISLRLYRGAHVVLAGNRLVYGQLAKRGIEESRMGMYFPAIDVEGIRSAVPRHGYDVLFVGRLVARKGIFDLVEAVRETGLTVGLVGDGEDRALLARCIEEAGLSSRVRILGALPAREMYGLLRGCTCFALPSYEEGYGMVIAEAIAADKPVVAYALAHYAEAFGEAFVPVPLGDRDALRGAILGVVDGAIDLERLAAARAALALQTAESGARQVLEYMERRLAQPGDIEVRR